MLTAEELQQLQHHPLQDDTNPTETSIEEAQVEEDIREQLADVDAASSQIRLNRTKHVQFIQKLLSQPLPASYVGFDATRPWLLYWSLHTMTLLGQGIDEWTKARAVSTLLSCQSKEAGGFAGGPGQIPHLMASYATINTLAIVGGPGPLPSKEELAQIKAGQTTMAKLGKGGWDAIDRKKLHAWLMRLKQPDGSFTVHEGGEVDVRASYCVWTIAALTGIATSQLLQGMAGFLASCQSYEGGLSSTSYPTYDSQLNLDAQVPRPALGEAHGGYAFCAAATYLGLRLLQPSLYPSSRSIAMDQDDASAYATSSKGCRLNLKTLTRWTLGLQCPYPSQGGGFKGRINKLVDGCYSWFSGSGMWGALESLLTLEQEQKQSLPSQSSKSISDLYSRPALQLYILNVAQALSGGLRDKPGKKADSYHTCYNLSGLAASQHIARPDGPTRKFCYESWKKNASPIGDDGADSEEEEELRRRVFASTLGYNLVDGREKIVVGDASNELLPTHPVVNVGFLQVRAILLWAYGQ